MIARNITRRVAASIASAGITLALVATNAPAANTDLPDAAGVVGGYQQVRGWVHEFDLPEPDDDAARIAIDDAPAACIILRRDGRVVGVGIDTSGDDLMLRRATGRALGRVLSHPALARITDRLRKDQAPGLDVEDLRRTLGRSLTLELEVAGPVTPLLGRSYEQVARQVEPGLDGVALRRGQDWAMLFPSRLRASNRATDVAAALSSLAGELGLATAPLEELIRLHDVAVYRFRTIHLAQVAPDRGPFETIRGDQVVPLDAVTPPSIARLADGIAARLCGTMWPVAPPPWVEGTYEKPPGVMGDYHAIADEYQPATAPPLAQALVALALSTYQQTPGTDGETARLAGDASVQILHDLAEWNASTTFMATDVQAAAAIIYAIGSRRDQQRTTDALLRSLRAEARQALLDASSDDDARARTPHGQAMVAGALARLLVADDADDLATGLDPALVRRMIDLAWRSAPNAQHVALLPWIAWAESDYAAATGDPIANVGAVRRIREMIQVSRVGPGARAGPADLDGGFALRRGQTARADAQGTRPMIALGWMSRRPEFTPPAERPDAIARQRQAMRFLMQLVAREETLWAYPNPDRVRGGVRAAAWNADQPVLAQAMGLLAACETIRDEGEPTW
ncbi:MAG: hypothetical protein ACYTGG_07275 [Planctomycetota bacterium]